MILDANYGAVAQAFVDARRNSEVVADYPGTMPGDFHEAYRIQDAAIHLIGKPIGGWKVGRVPDHLIPQFGVNRLAGPIFSETILFANHENRKSVPVLKGFAAVEAEIMLRVGSAPGEDTNLFSIRDHIDEVRFGLEIACSPFPGINDHGPAVTASDFGNNFGLVLGPVIDDWRSRDLLNSEVTLSIDGQIVGTGLPSNMLDGPFGAAAFLSNLLAARGIALVPGVWISSGAITGVHKIEAGQSVHAVFDNAFDVSCVAQLFLPGTSAKEEN